MYNNTRMQKKHTVQHPYTYTKTQVMITTIVIIHKCPDTDCYTTMYTQHTNIYYNLSQMVKKLSFRAP